MKGLIIKDILGVKKQAVIIGILMLFYSLIGVVLKNSSFSIGFVSGFMVVVCSMTVITTFANDEMAKWDRFALTMPVSRKEYVLSKYIVALIFLAVGIIASLVFISISIAFKKSAENVGIIVTAIATISILVTAINLPLLFKFKSEKTRYIIIIIMIIPLAVVMCASGFIEGGRMPSEQLIKTVIYSTPIIAILLFALSFFISCKIMKTKEVA